MSIEKAIEVLQSHKFHWERLLREKICDKTEGTDFINAVDMAIKALEYMLEDWEEYEEYCKSKESEEEE